MQTFEHLLAKVQEEISTDYADFAGNYPKGLLALRSIMEIHYLDIGTPLDEMIYMCDYCKVPYPCKTIDAIEKALM